MNNVRMPLNEIRRFLFYETVVANAKMKKELQEIENRILFLLSNSKGNILDDHELIETLASSKKTSTEITLKVRKIFYFIDAVVLLGVYLR